MLLADHAIYLLESLLEDLRDKVLVAYSYIFQVEWLLVSGGSTLGAPLRLHVAIGILYEVQDVLNVVVELLHGYSALLTILQKLYIGTLGGVVGIVGVTSGVLAGYARSDHGERLGADVLAEAEVFVVAQSARLMVAPEVTQRLALMEFADGALPVVDVVDAVAMRHASTGEAHEARMEVGKRLGEVGTQSVAATVEGGAREERNHVYIVCRRSLGLDGEVGSGGVGVGRKHRLQLGPRLGGQSDR